MSNGVHRAYRIRCIFATSLILEHACAALIEELRRQTAEQVAQIEALRAENQLLQLNVQFLLQRVVAYYGGSRLPRSRKKALLSVVGLW